VNILGIDPGLTGGLAVVDSFGKLVKAWEMPRAASGELDLNRLTAIVLDAVHKCGVNHGIIEQVHAMPGQGVSSMFKFGMVFGAVQGILAARSIPFTLVRPQAWQKLAFVGVSEIKSAERITKTGKTVKAKREPKKMAAVAASRLFPGADLTSSTGSAFHEGKTDAALIAFYGARALYGSKL
jgi:crossover junction endodeoxyribonuclease RuvC